MTKFTVFETEIPFNFSRSMSDVEYLLNLHASQGSGSRPPPEATALTRSAVILTVTAWETFIEDVVRHVLKKRLQHATQPGVLSGALSNTPATSSWKRQISDSLEKNLEGFHTPSPKKIRELTQHYLDIDVTTAWQWRNMKANVACAKLDALVRLRGRLVHVGSKLFDEKAPVSKKQAIEGARLVRRLAAISVDRFNLGPKTKAP